MTNFDDQTNFIILEDLGRCYFYDDFDTSIEDICSQVAAENSPDYVQQIVGVLDSILSKKLLPHTIDFFATNWNRSFDSEEILVDFLSQIRLCLYKGLHKV